MKTIKLFAILTVFLFATDMAIAATYYVRSGASGSGSDWSNAYGALPATLQRGSTYYVAAGSYPGRTFNTPASGTSLITIKKATESDHGTSTGWQSSYGTGQANFTSQLSFQSSHWLVDGQTGGGPGSWNTGFGFKVTERGDSNAVIKVGSTASEPRYTNITVRHIDIQGKGAAGSAGGSASNDGVAIYGGSSFTLSYAWFHGIGRCPIFGYSQGVLLFEYAYVSDFNYFGANGVHSEVASLGQNSVDDFTMRYSLVTDVQSTGGLMWNSAKNPNAHMYVYGNVFYRPAGRTWSRANGVIGGWTTATAPVRNVWVYNNTFINVDYMPLGTLPQAYSGNRAYNNIFYNCVSPNFSRFPDHGYNHFINSGPADANGTTGTGDPFVNYVGLDFRLKTPIATGASLPSPISLAPLGMSGVIYRGAYPVAGATTPTPTISPPGNLRL